MADPIRRIAADHEIEVLLSGVGGDEWFTGSKYYGADLLRSGRLLTLVRLLRGQEWPDATDRRAVTGALRIACASIVPRPVKQGLKRLLDMKPRVPNWVTKQLVERTRLVERVQNRPAPPPCRSLCQRDVFACLTSGWGVHALEMDDRTACREGMQQRHPLLDRRIIEFALSLPEDQRRSRKLMRSAMRHILPERVRQRSDKAEFSAITMAALQAFSEFEKNIDSSAAVQLGWVNADSVRHIWKLADSLHARRDPGYTEYSSSLWMVIAIEAWLRAVRCG